MQDELQLEVLNCRTSEQLLIVALLLKRDALTFKQLYTLYSKVREDIRHVAVLSCIPILFIAILYIQTSKTGMQNRFHDTARLQEMKLTIHWLKKELEF